LTNNNIMGIKLNLEIKLPSNQKVEVPSIIFISYRHLFSRRNSMTLKKKIINIMATTCTIILLLSLTFVAAFAADKNVAAGATWIVDKTTSLNNLTIENGATVKTPEGKLVTLTVDGVETPVEAKTYKGNIVLTVTKDIPVTVTGMANRTYHYRTAIDIENGKYMADKSVAAAVVGGTVTDTSAKDVMITSAGPNFNGIIVTGDTKSSYSIINPVIKMTGNGTNDFAGFGASIMTSGKAEVTIENAKINNTGAVRTAIWVGGDSITKINNSEIEVHNGTLPKTYGWSWTKGGGGDSGDVMMEVPWMLGLVGNCRATNALGNGDATYNNTHVKAQAWGVLSTDACKNTKLTAIKCLLETVESGYGSYADGAVNTFSGCTFNVNDYGLIITGGSGTFTDGTVVNSGRFGVMSHRGSGKIIVEKGSVFNTKKAVFQVKSGKPTFIVDNAKLNSASGMILQAMVNDDPNSNFGAAPPQGTAGGVPGGGGAPGAGGPGGAPGGDKGGAPGAMGGVPGAAAGGAPAGGAQGGMPGGTGSGATAVTATFKNMTMNGDIVNSMTSESDVAVSFEKANITGAITTATAVHAVAKNGEKLVMQDKPDLYYLVGEVIETYAPTNDKYGVKVSLDSVSTWVVSKSSYLTGLTIANGATVTAPKGFKVTMTVDGAAKEIKPGDYKGKISLTITKI
jgi:hypothetical protein